MFWFGYGMSVLCSLLKRWPLLENSALNLHAVGGLKTYKKRCTLTNWLMHWFGSSSSSSSLLATSEKFSSSSFSVFSSSDLSLASDDPSYKHLDLLLTAISWQIGRHSIDWGSLLCDMLIQRLCQSHSCAQTYDCCSPTLLFIKTNSSNRQKND